ncbi:MAG: SPOR domain-containing protein [Lachnospiraceae bacterium]
MDYEENLGMSSSSVGNVSGNAMGNVMGNTMGNTMDNMNDGMGQMNMMDRHGMENRDMVERMVMPRNMENMSNMANMTNMDGGMDDMNRKLYRVQVGAYQNKENADRMLNSLLSDGFPAFMIFDDGLYKVQVGAYEFLPNAIRMENNLRRYRYNTYITT